MNNTAESIHNETRTTKKIKNSPCDLIFCQNNSTCVLDTLRHIYKCECMEGYTGNRCEEKVKKEKVEEAAIKEMNVCKMYKPCLNSGICSKRT